MTTKLSAVASRRIEQIPLCHFVVLLLLIESCQSANHYCVNGHTMSIRMGGLYHKDETIIPEIPDEPIYKRGSYRSCSWEISVDEVGNQNAQIVLEGVNLESVNSDLSGSSNKAQVNISLNRIENVTLGMFQVKPLSQRNHISVQINWDPKTQSRSPVNLRILIPVAGLCSRDMLGFRDSCHGVSTVPADIMKAVEHCSGDARLASFTSMAHINEFIAANEARQNELPYKSPLDLSEWVRLGMFYRAGDGAILSVVRTESGCELMEVDKHLFEVSQKNGPCGSLKANEFGQAVLQFGDCNKSMQTLMSFSETAKPAPDNSLNCSKYLLHEIPLLLSKSTKDFAKTSTSRFTAITENHENSHTNATVSGFTYPGNRNSNLILIYSLSGTAAVIVLAGILTGVIIFNRRRRRFKSDRASKPKKRVHTGSRQVATLAKPELNGQQMAGSMEDLEAKNVYICETCSGSPLLPHANPIFNC